MKNYKEKTWDEKLELANIKTCIECGVNEVPDFEFEYCCNGYMCACYGFPINVDYCICEECKTSLELEDLKGVN